MVDQPVVYNVLCSTVALHGFPMALLWPGGSTNARRLRGSKALDGDHNGFAGRAVVQVFFCMLMVCTALETVCVE